jgi:hypothetical protein
MTTIDPKDFSDRAWGELANATELGLIDTDPQPREATVAELEAAIEAVSNKIAKVEDGFYGEDDEEVDTEEWAENLREAAAVLVAYLGGAK